MTMTAQQQVRDNRTQTNIMRSLAVTLASDTGQLIRTPTVTSRLTLADHHKVAGYLEDMTSAVCDKLHALIGLSRTALGDYAADNAGHAHRDAVRAASFIEETTVALQKALASVTARDAKHPHLAVNPSSELLRALREANVDVRGYVNLTRAADATMIEGLANHLAGYCKNLADIVAAERMLVDQVCTPRVLPFPRIPSIGRRVHACLEGTLRDLRLVARDLGEVQALARSKREGG
jgi:hypothetical protein